MAQSLGEAGLASLLIADFKSVEIEGGQVRKYGGQEAGELRRETPICLAWEDGVTIAVDNGL